MAQRGNLRALVGICDLLSLLEVEIKRKSNSWDVRTLWSIVWNAIKSTCDCLQTNNAEHCNDDCWFSLDNTMNLVGNKVTVNFKLLICLKITLVKFANPNGWAGLDWAIPSLFHYSLLKIHSSISKCLLFSPVISYNMQEGCCSFRAT